MKYLLLFQAVGTATVRTETKEYLVIPLLTFEKVKEEVHVDTHKLKHYYLNCIITFIETPYML